MFEIEYKLKIVEKDVVNIGGFPYGGYKLGNVWTVQTKYTEFCTVYFGTHCTLVRTLLNDQV